MIIRLSKKQQHDLLVWSGRITAAHFEEECEPPGYDLNISVTSLGASAEARCGPEMLDLGDVELIVE